MTALKAITVYYHDLTFLSSLGIGNEKCGLHDARGKVTWMGKVNKGDKIKNNSRTCWSDEQSGPDWLWNEVTTWGLSDGEWRIKDRILVPHDPNLLVLLPWSYMAKGGSSGCYQSNQMYPLKPNSFVRLVAERSARLEHKGDLLQVLKIGGVTS